jgi:UPF0755 protein
MDEYYEWLRIREKKWCLIFFALAFFVIFYLSFFSWRAPTDFPVNSTYTVEKGIGLSSLTIDLHNKNIIRSPFWFKVFSVLFGGTKGVMAGDYALNSSQNIITLAQRINNGNFDLKLISITIPEGLNVFEIGKLVSQKFLKINVVDFVKLASSDEGYLFPDTYLFLPNATTEDIIAELKNNFAKKIETIKDDITNFKKPLVDIIKLASIVEEEARTTETRRVVAGILWQRLDLGMPLQVDASFKYINGKVTKDLTLADLKIDSPYNSYLYKGFPPTPICNPGLDSIRAVTNPIKTDYLYFLSDKVGEMHYAKTFAEHLRNKERYLK